VFSIGLFWAFDQGWQETSYKRLDCWSKISPRRQNLVLLRGRRQSGLRFTCILRRWNKKPRRGEAWRLLVVTAVVDRGTGVTWLQALLIVKDYSRRSSQVLRGI